MQTIGVPTGVHNPSGHSESEIVSALCASTGSRKLSFRYELLDLNNAFISDLSSVLSCRIEQNWLSDVKRKASFVVKDDGVIDFLQNRIKPWVRLHIPPYGSNDWVEWPQGVFLLTSPSRASDSSGVVTRDVQGYDLIQSLIDDVVTSRYTVPTTSALTEDFEDSEFDKFQISGTWARSSTRAKTGTYSMRSAVIGHNGTTDMLVYVPAGSTTMTFSHWVSSESGYDFFKVYSNTGSELLSSSGVASAWTDASLTVTGLPFVRFRYYKDSSSTSGDDAVFVDNISFTDAGTRYTDVIKSLLSGYSLSLSLSSAVVPAAVEYDPGTPKIKIINDLLSAINYNSLSFDENGVAIVSPYVSPSERNPGYSYSDTTDSVINPGVKQDLDVFSVPNTWVLVVSEPDRTVLSSTYVNSDPSSPTSTVNRGRTIVKYVTGVSAADQSTLDAKAARAAFDASQIFETVTFSTAIMPFHSGNDVLSIRLGSLAIDAKYVETSWSFPLESGGSMRHSVRRVVSV